MKKRMRVFSVLSAVAGVQISPGAARAAEVCDTVEACRALQAQVEARLAVLLKNTAPNLTDIVRNADGSVRLMNQHDAESYCHSKGQRLPTVRELALYAQSMGAQEISETANIGNYLVKGNDSAGNPDNFYCSPEGYQRPAGVLGNYWFWSSSVHPDFSGSAYVLHGSTGQIYSDNNILSHGLVNDLSAVRCAQSR